MRRYTIISVILAVASVFSCEKGPEEVEITGIGCRESVVSASWDALECSAEILATGAFTAAIPEDVSWISFKNQGGARTVSMNGDCTLTFKLEVNRNIPRSVDVTLNCGTAKTILTINQDGLLDDGLDVEQKNVLVSSEGGRYSAKISTKINASAFRFEADYLEESSTGWVSGAKISGNFVVFDVEPNLEDGLIRHADIRIIWSDGQGVVHITQYSDGYSVEPIGVTDLKALLPGKGSLQIDKHYIVSGLVINDDTEGNGAENRLVSIDNPEMAYSSKILYVQSEDGADGIKLIFNGSCADLATRYDRISFDACGLTLERKDNPVRYEITGIPLSAVTESQRMDAPVAKSRTIASLSDQDLYTLVKLDNVTLPIRKGPFVPVDIRYIDLVTAYPMVLNDNEGNSIYMMVNSDCIWSRDGNPMPQGAGSVTGVLVYEKSDNFEWDIAQESAMKADGVLPDYITGIGNIGSWQIRPVSRGDIAIEDNLDDSFSALLYEWRYCDSLGVNLVANYDGDARRLYPTYPVVSEPKTLDAWLYCQGKDDNAKLKVCNDFTHLGPYTYGGNISHPENGNGVYDALGRSAHWYVYSSTNTIGVIYSQYLAEDTVNWSICNGSSWCVPGWSTKQYWCCEFSTSELTEANAPLNVVFGTLNHIGYTGAPRYWAVEWSEDGDTWNREKTYSVPDFPSTSSRKVYYLPGAKYVSVKLPDEVIGLEKVYVRLVPMSDKGIGTSSSYYSASSAINATRYNALNYFAIRYNK